MSMLTRMHELVKEGSQFIIATHSPIIMAYPQAVIYQIKEGFEQIGYEETEHYQVTQYFLNNTQKMLSILLEWSFWKIINLKKLLGRKFHIVRSIFHSTQKFDFKFTSNLRHCLFPYSPTYTKNCPCHLQKLAKSVATFFAGFLDCHWSLQYSRNHCGYGYCLSAWHYPTLHDDR